MGTQTAKDFEPGTFGCHEALHMTSYFAEQVSSLADHPAISAKAEWRQMAVDASDRLFDLYQAIGSVHLTAVPEAQPEPEFP